MNSKQFASAPKAEPVPAVEYPPLPEPYHVAYDDIDKEDVKCFAEGQLHAYGEACWKHAYKHAALAQAAPAAVASPLTKLQRKAIAVCFTSDKVSVSEVQRKLSISYADAQTLCQSIVDLGLTDELELAPSLKQRGAPAPQAAPVAQGDAEDAARLDFMIEHRAYVVSDPDACPGYWLHFVHKETGCTWVQSDEHPTPRAAIDAARSQAKEGA